MSSRHPGRGRFLPAPGFPAARGAVLDLDKLDPDADPLERAERAVLRTVLPEPALPSLRRPAQENESARRNA
jgi:hypothetical protein